ncbi:MAG: M28 family peptidase [Clostridiales Family XIII bacterium]|jgi:DNA-binding ferritin-like protein (Dps family)|nr:M28 family peptidase [Clostridiales Family XIII bacterium]
MKIGVTIIAVAAIIAVAILAIVGTMQPPEEEAPVRDAAPLGYDDFDVAVDPEFSKVVALQLADLGDDPVLGFRSAGSPAEGEAATLLAQTMRDIGLENVTVDKAASDGWTFGGANITYKASDGTVTVSALGGYQTDIVAEGEKLPIVYLGKGTAADYEGVDVTGKLVLIDIDQENEWWINYPAYQAHRKGARAVVACSIMEEENDARIGSQDICGGADAPALAISARDSKTIQNAINANGYEVGGVRQINVILNADSKVEINKGTSNVWGEIPGKTSEAILFIAHYDGYYHSFYDDASGVGIVLGIAKALREGGVKPEKTFRFILHGAEEWGKSGTEADWATGAYEQIVNNRPGWAEQAFALFNVDSGYPLEPMRSFEVNAPDELRNFVNSSIASFGDRGAVSVTPSISPPSTYREDFIYNASGVPTIAIEGGEGDEQYYASMYHSSMDRLDVGGYSADGARGMSRYLGYAALMLDRMPLRPISFANRIEEFRKTLQDSEGNYSAGNVGMHLIANVDRAAEAAKTLDQFIVDFNSEYTLAAAGAEARVENSSETDAGSAAEDEKRKLKEMKARAPEVNAEIYKVYREMQDELLKLNRDMEAGFANEGLQRNIIHLEEAENALEHSDAQAALDSLSEIESVYAATAFDKETCDKFVQSLDDRIKGTWAEGRVVSRACYADDIVRSLIDRPEYGANDFSVERGMINALIESQTDTLKAVYSGQEDGLAMLTDGMNALLDVYAEANES